MSSLAKLEANRRNAALSTGPRTTEGKAVVARNATTHGIFAAVPVLPGESPEAWADHRHGVVQSLAPVGLLELNLAERAALILWRLQRLARYEAESTAARMDRHDVPSTRGLDDPLALLRTSDRSAQLRALRQKLKTSREELASVSAAGDFLLNVESARSEAVPPGLARTVFHAAYDLVFADSDRVDDPPEFGSKGFRRRLNLPAAPEPIAWTTDVIRHGFTVYAALVRQPAATVLGATQENLTDRAAELNRTIARLEREIAAVEKHLEFGNAAKKAEELLPGEGRDERIAKYERHLHAMLTSTLHELERLQARRGGEVLPLPAVGEITVTVVSAPA